MTIDENFHSTCSTCKKLLPNQHFDCQREMLKAEREKIYGDIVFLYTQEFSHITRDYREVDKFRDKVLHIVKGDL